MNESDKMVNRSEDILKLSYLKIPVPEHMPRQRKLVEFARDAANLILSLQPAAEEDAARCLCNQCGVKDRCRHYLKIGVLSASKGG